MNVYARQSTYQCSCIRNAPTLHRAQSKRLGCRGTWSQEPKRGLKRRCQSRKAQCQEFTYFAKNRHKPFLLHTSNRVEGNHEKVARQDSEEHRTMQAEYSRTPANRIDSSVKALALASIGSTFEFYDFVIF